jgi:hypothetical protein
MTTYQKDIKKGCFFSFFQHLKYKDKDSTFELKAHCEDFKIIN